MKRTNFLKTLGAAIATPIITPVARFLPLAPVAVAEVEDLSRTPISQLWLSWSKEPFSVEIDAKSFVGSFRLDLVTEERIRNLIESGEKTFHIRNLTNKSSYTGAISSGQIHSLLRLFKDSWNGVSWIIPRP